MGLRYRKKTPVVTANRLIVGHFTVNGTTEEKSIKK